MEATYTLQEMVMQLADAAHDLVPGVTSASNGTANKMTTAGQAGRRPRQWEYSEVVFLEPQATAGGRAQPQPFVVTDYVDGVFSFDHDFGPAGTAQGLPFFIVRNHGQGNPYRSYVNALARAVRWLGAPSVVEDTSLTTSAGLYTYTVPPSLDTVYAVYAQAEEYTVELRPDQWELHPGRGVLFTRDVAVDYPLGLTLAGRKFGQLPTTLDGTIEIDLDEAIDRALEYLSRNSNRPVEQAKGGNLQAERLRTARRYALPNEMRVLP